MGKVVPRLGVGLSGPGGAGMETQPQGKVAAMPIEDLKICPDFVEQGLQANAPGGLPRGLLRLQVGEGLNFADRRAFDALRAPQCPIKIRASNRQVAKGGRFIHRMALMSVSIISSAVVTTFEAAE